jgi:glycosyltransferase involved in cell wall biosynthesis
MAKLSIIVPVYNEHDTVADLLERVLSLDIDKEIIVIDDGSTDGTSEVLKEFDHETITMMHHSENRGKGAAIRSGLESATGEYVIIQDADLEYDPAQIGQFMAPLERGECDAVYGNRFPLAKRSEFHGVYILIYVANLFLSRFLSLLFARRVHDFETCYKIMRTDVAKSLRLRSDRFDIEPEITAKLLRRGYRIKEIPISYHHRHYSEGKKITWRDGVSAFLAIIKFRFID